MYDRIPSPGKENRVSITQDNGQVITGVLAYADDATQEGSAYTKGNVLPDDVCNLLGIDPDTSEPKDAWIGVITALGYSPVRIKVTTAAGNPMAGVSVSGLTGILPEYAVTDQNGIVFVILNEGDYTLSVPSVNCLDATISPVSVEVRANGQVQNVEIKQVSNGVTSKTFSSSGQFMLSDNVLSADVWALGGGGGGGSGGQAVLSGYNLCSGGGGGGGGGRTSQRSGITPTPFFQYSVTVGSGGRAGPATGSNRTTNGFSGGYGGSSSCTLGIVTASGGAGGSGGSAPGITSGCNGGSGGSGGGAGGQMYEDRWPPQASAGGDGGSSGSSGADTGGDVQGSGGSGQGSATGPFGTNDNRYGAGGGGGGGYENGSNPGGSGGASTAGAGGSWTGVASAGTSARAGFGCGGGGGSGGWYKTDGSIDYTQYRPKAGGSGGSGLVMVRWVNAS